MMGRGGRMAARRGHDIGKVPDGGDVRVTGDIALTGSLQERVDGIAISFYASGERPEGVLAGVMDAMSGLDDPVRRVRSERDGSSHQDEAVIRPLGLAKLAGRSPVPDDPKGASAGTPISLKQGVNRLAARRSYHSDLSHLSTNRCPSRPRIGSDPGRKRCLRRLQRPWG